MLPRLFIGIVLALSLTFSYAQTQFNLKLGEINELDKTYRSIEGNQLDATTAWTNLPDIWNRSHTVGRWQHTVPFLLHRTPTELWGLYIPRAGNRLQIILNDKPLLKLGDWGQTQFDYAQKPHYIQIPEGYLVQGANKLVIALEGEKSRYAGLSRLYLGPNSQLRPIYSWRYFFQTLGAYAVIFVCLIFAIFGLGLAWRLKEGQFWLFTASCAFCAIRTSYAVVDTIPFSYQTWAWIVDVSYVAFTAFMATFCVRELALKKQWIFKLIYFYLALCITLITAYVIFLLPSLRQAWNLLTFIFVGVMSILFIATWYTQRTSTSSTFAIASIMAVLMGGYDHWLVYYSNDGYGGFTLVRYALVAFLIAMAWVMTDRLLQQVQKEQALRIAVEQELQERRLELAKEYANKAELIAAQAHSHERRRLLQDLHDGMGLQLNSLLGMVEHEVIQKEELRTEVRTTIEQLRVLMDGTDNFEGTVPELLGHIRYRIETRLKRQHIELKWEMNLPPMTDLVSQDAALSLQRLVFELCTNVIKHAKATEILVRITLKNQTALDILFQDNGTGQIGEHQGIGNASTKRRVIELNAVHDVKNVHPHGISHHLSIPLQKIVQSPI